MELDEAAELGNGAAESPFLLINLQYVLRRMTSPREAFEIQPDAFDSDELSATAAEYY